MTITGTNLTFLGALDEQFASIIVVKTVAEDGCLPDPHHPLSGRKIRCVGLIPKLSKDVPVVLDGRLEGDDFRVERYRHSTDLTAIRDYLKKAKFLTESEIKTFIRHFTGNSFWDFGLEETDVDFGKINPAKLENIKEVLKKTRVIEKVFFTLFDLRFTAAETEKFLSYHKTLEELYAHPYSVGFLCGLDLNKVDNCAKRFNEEGKTDKEFHTYSPERIRFILRKVAETAESNGHTYVTPKLLEEYVGRRSNSFHLPTPDRDIVTLQALSDPLFMLSTGDNVRFYLSRYIRLEEEAAGHLARLSKKPLTPLKVPKAALKGCDEGQKAAVIGCLLSSPLNILTGGPGTGKTTTTRVLVKQLEKNGHNVMLCAPTGRASVRLKESTKHKAYTIHRMLGIRPFMGDDFQAQYGEDHPLECDAIVIDEVSMLSLELFVMLLRALPEGCRVIFVGDEDQLPSISPGNVLHDLCVSGICPVFRLTEVHRQADGSSIVDNAYHVLNAEPLTSDKDFEIVNLADQKEALRYVLDLFRREYQKDDPYYFQILCPAKIGDTGVNNINDKILEMDTTRKIRRGKYAVGDKVMTIRNNYNPPVGYMNGDIGIIRDITEELITVEIGKGKLIYVDDIMDLQHAYASTIHKSQGSEYEHVAIVLDGERSGMMYKNLLYTAITRARKKVTIINVRRGLEKSVRNEAPERLSGLADRLVTIKMGENEGEE